MDGRKLRQTAALPGLSLLMATALTACDSPGMPLRSRQVASIGGTAGQNALAARLVGTWRRTLFFFDEFGFAHSSETTWQFQADGSALRVQVTRNLSLFLSDASVTVARWRVEGTSLHITFVSPQPGEATFALRIEGRQLFLNGEQYERVDG